MMAEQLRESTTQLVIEGGHRLSGRIEVEGNKIRIETENASRIVALKRSAIRCGVADGRELEIEVPEDAGYVRFECWGAGEGFAWTQPFFCS